jgi:chorismate-pyruvate lyase
LVSFGENIMALTLDPLLKKILDAPVGEVEKTLRDVLECDIHLDIIEQNQTSGSDFVRKITITANEIPVICAIVNFDSKILPANVISEILQKKEGIGTILSRNNIKANRKIISSDYDDKLDKVTRKYQIIKDNTVWFEIVEEIRLDYIISCKNY